MKPVQGMICNDRFKQELDMLHVDVNLRPTINQSENRGLTQMMTDM